MTQDERIRAVVDCGFTERQARFLVLVMRHGGVWIARQYASFAADVLAEHPEFVAEIVESFPVCYPLTELSVIRHEPDNRLSNARLAQTRNSS